MESAGRTRITLVEPEVGAGLVGHLFGGPGRIEGELDLDVLGVIAAAFGLATAVEVSGLADTIANSLITGLGAWGEIGILAGVVLATVALTELVTNNAAAVLMYPICMAAAKTLGVSPLPFVFAVMMAASASFATPLGYQTNLMVYGPGGYRFTDYFRLGFPLTVVVMIIIAVFVPMFWPF